ncbi:short-chain dehydrogenase [Novosphingobium endophyticum]|uniref:Short-chain dehydrogenase n=1 Tax=Novosphingobium endophyticum TaxID=1955250 RepID=A0A916TS66_9SPHN|nr:glucose 1-dehydrogenase [Novosphingobium endophyticum]GGC01034.1 short-chain dehydrogenase [Novosphingobium endophyticum]
MKPVRDVSDKSIAELVSLAGRNAVVTGGGQGLGKGIARRLAEAGANVLIGDIDGERAAAAAASLDTEFPGRVVGVQMDVSLSSSISAAVASMRERFGGIEIWVNNAGVFPNMPLLDMTDELWDRVNAVNARGTFVGSREAARTMVEAGCGGVIVNIASLAGVRGIAPGLSAYVGSKHAVVGLTKQMALELAPENIRVLAVAPTFIVTEGNLAMMQADPSRAEAAAMDIPSMLTSKLGRVGVPDDIARAVLFAASDMSLFMTGSVLMVDAGETI